jgi:hypothetical protein
MQIAKQDCYGTDGLGVRRFVRAGDPIPPGLELEDPSDAIERDPIPGETVPSPSPITGDYDSRHADELQAEANRRGLTVEGTGKDGNVLKSDLVEALEASDG